MSTTYKLLPEMFYFLDIYTRSGDFIGTAYTRQMLVDLVPCEPWSRNELGGWTIADPYAAHSLNDLDEVGLSIVTPYEYCFRFTS